MNVQREDASGPDIQTRSFEFALRIIRLSANLLRTSEDVARVIGRQLLRSGTSVGAQISEAQSAESPADFLHKMMLAQKEARESPYWLRLLLESKTLPAERLGSLIDETNQLIAIISAIAISTKRNRQRANAS